MQAFILELSYYFILNLSCFILNLFCFVHYQSLILSCLVLKDFGYFVLDLSYLILVDFSCFILIDLGYYILIFGHLFLINLDGFIFFNLSYFILVLNYFILIFNCLILIFNCFVLQFRLCFVLQFYYCLIVYLFFGLYFRLALYFRILDSNMNYIMSFGPISQSCTIFLSILSIKYEL